MTEDIKKNLSKCKYVYRLYIEHENFHIEKYPIVYINSNIVYFKKNKKNVIEMMSFSDRFNNVKESFEEAIKYINNMFTFYTYYPVSVSVYFVEIDKLKEFDLSLIKERLKEESKESKIKKQEREVEKYKKSYELELRKLEEMKKEFGIECNNEDSDVK